MKSKIVCSIVFIYFCTLPLGYAIKCYRCGETEASCINAKTYECNQMYANETSRFLNDYYLNVNTNSTSNGFSCMQQDIKFAISGIVKYKGCIYSHMNSCGYTFQPYYQQGPSTFSCKQCQYNGCNPADQKSLSTAAMVLPLAFVLLYKYFMEFRN